MIENTKVKTTKDLVGFVITSICDADLRAKVQDIPDLLDDSKNNFDVNEFIDTLKSDLNNEPSAEVQNSAMLFIELILKGNLSITPKQLSKLSDLSK